MGELSAMGLLGASGLVGACVRTMLVRNGRKVFAFSTQAHRGVAQPGVTWHRVDGVLLPQLKDILAPDWLCVAPVWVLPQYFQMLEGFGCRRIVALSSTSRFSKLTPADSPDAHENALALRLVRGEELLSTWAESKGIEWVILRPTLVYGLGQDKNIAEIAGFIRRFGFFPLLGNAMGLRQPIHAQDVAAACLAALNSPAAANRAYNISGGEALPYREMVGRVFAALQRQPRLFTIPIAAFRLAVAVLRALPRYRHWSAAMAQRMNRDLVYDHADAARDLDFSPRPFRLAREDLP